MASTTSVSPASDGRTVDAAHRRRAATVGHVVAAVAVLTTALSLFGDTPDTHDTSPEVASWFREHRTGVLAGTWLLTLWFAWLGWRALTIAGRLGPPRRALADGIRVATTITLTVYALTLALPYVALAVIVAVDSPGDAKSLFAVTLVATNVLAWPLGVLMLAVARATWRAPSRWPSVLSLVLGVLVAVATVSFADRGPFSPDVQQQVVYGALTVWIVVLVGARPTSNRVA